MKRFALIGRTLGHSYSQHWFEEMFAREGLSDYSYRLVEMASLEDLREWVKKEGINGFNVTAPYKQEIIPFLDKLDETASIIGAVNCVTVERQANLPGHEGAALSTAEIKPLAKKQSSNQAIRLIGHNTDAPAFQETLDNFISPFTSNLSPLTSAYILGTGGAAHAVAYALEEMGIKYQFVSRHPELHLNAISYEELPFLMLRSSFFILINATPVGMYPDIDATPLDASHAFIHSNAFVYDLIYNPSPTRLLREAAACGAKTKDGLEMLYRQAEQSWEWFQRC